MNGGRKRCFVRYIRSLKVQPRVAFERSCILYLLKRMLLIFAALFA